MYDIKRIPPVSCAMIIGLLAGSGFFTWSVVAIFVDGIRAVISGGGWGMNNPLYWVHVAFNTTVFPLIAIALGFVAGFVVSGLYNIWARCIGGVEFDLKLTKER